MLLVILIEKKLFERFMKKTPQKTNKEFRVEKVIIEKAINYMLNGKATIIILTAGLIKRTDIN